jgi:hypothetical protein
MTSASCSSRASIARRRAARRLSCSRSRRSSQTSCSGPRSLGSAVRLQFGAGVGAQLLGEGLPDLLVGGERVGRAAGLAQRADAECLQRLVQGVRGGQDGQLGQHPLGPAEGHLGGEAEPLGVQPQRLVAGRCRGSVGQVGESRAAPQRQGVVQCARGLRRVAVGEGLAAFVHEPLESVRVDCVGTGGEAVTAVHRADRLMPDRPAQPPHQRLQRPRRVRRRLPVPHLTDQSVRRPHPSRAQRQRRKQCAQPRPRQRHGAAVVPASLRRPQNPIAHRPILAESPTPEGRPGLFVPTRASGRLPPSPSRPADGDTIG